MDYPVVENDTFELRPLSSGGRMEVRMTGNADQRVVDDLDTALQVLHEVVLAEGLREVEFDIRELYFMNSSCFKCFVTFVVTVLDLPKLKRYPIVFLSNRRMRWQDRSLGALRALATDIVRVEPD